MDANIAAAVNLCAILTIYPYPMAARTTDGWADRESALNKIEDWASGCTEDMPPGVVLPPIGKVCRLRAVVQRAELGLLGPAPAMLVQPAASGAQGLRLLQGGVQ
jgi:hypothetical protein